MCSWNMCVYTIKQERSFPDQEPLEKLTFEGPEGYEKRRGGSRHVFKAKFMRPPRRTDNGACYQTGESSPE